MGGQHLRDAAHVGGHHAEPGKGCLQDGDAEGFGEGGVEEDVAAVEDRADLGVGDAA